MRIVFMGTPDFAVPSLQALLDAGHEVAAVYTQPDKPQGRKQILTAPPSGGTIWGWTGTHCTRNICS